MGNTDKFDMIAAQYNTPGRIRMAEVSADAIRAYLVDSQNRTAIDFGCGTGLVDLNLLEDFRSILFLDASPSMIDQIKRKISYGDIRNADTLCFDLEKSSLPDLRADYIIMAQVLLHIKDYNPILLKLYNVLNPGGHLLIVDFDKNEKVVYDIVHSGFDREALTADMLKIGYKNITSKTFIHGSQIFMGQDASLFLLDAQK